MAVFKIKKGKNLPIVGEPQNRIANSLKSSEFALLPPEFEGVKFKVEVKEGDQVLIGSPLLSSRTHEDLKWTSPAGGVVQEIRRGEKRKLLAIVIRKEGRESYQQFPSFKNIAEVSRQELVSVLMASGLWVLLKQRPFNKIADPSVLPSSIFVRAMDTEPNAANKQILLKEQEIFFQKGIQALTVLVEQKPVYLCYDYKEKELSLAVQQNKIAQVHQFDGLHPAGNASTHIQALDPIKKGKQIWTIDAEFVATIGKFLSTGKVPVERIIALAGSQVENPQYYKTRVGVSLSAILQQNLKSEPARVIQGTVLSGFQSEQTGYLGMYTSTLTVIPELKDKEMFGWMKPGGDRHSFTRLFTSKLNPFKKFAMHTKLNGEFRALVFSDWYDQFVAVNVHTSFLLKACLAQDIERMEELGLLECVPEDFSLCTYACISKLEVDQIIKDGLELLSKEG